MLRKPIARLNPEMGFDHWLKLFGGYLPSTKMRWCTRQLKIKPFEAWVGDDVATSYIAIRADEDRAGYNPTKPNITPKYPFIEDGVTHADVLRILKDSGVGLPKYYEWRTRSGCYFCFFQRKAEWIGLKREHPDLFERAKEYEKIATDAGPGFTWSEREALSDLEKPEREREILERHVAAKARASERRTNLPLIDVLTDALDEESDERPCGMCNS